MSIKKQQYRQKYIARINQSIDYIEAHINDELRLDKIAKAADFSPYHFHRLFRAFTGETVNGFLKRIRLEKAGSILVNNPKYTITKIAYKLGFASSQDLARNFKAYFNMSPSIFREKYMNSKNCYVKSKNWKAAAGMFVYDKEKGRHIKIKK